jgi:hypothetical protein
MSVEKCPDCFANASLQTDRQLPARMRRLGLSSKLMTHDGKRQGSCYQISLLLLTKRECKGFQRREQIFASEIMYNVYILSEFVKAKPYCFFAYVNDFAVGSELLISPTKRELWHHDKTFITD